LGFVVIKKQAFLGALVSWCLGGELLEVPISLYPYRRLSGFIGGCGALRELSI
jgi:hypothetical protein